MIAIYFLIILTTATQSVSTKCFTKTGSNSLIFNSLKTSVAALIFALMSIGNFCFHLPTMIFGFLYGLGMSVSNYSGYNALKRGPMALTSMLVSFSVIIPLIWGITVGKESLTVYQYPAFILLFSAIILTNLNKILESRGKEKMKGGYGLWLLFVGLTFLCNGICSILQKQYQTVYSEAYNSQFMFYAMLIASMVFILAMPGRVSVKEFCHSPGKGYGVLAACMGGAANFLTLVLAGMENASVLFPIISAGTILTSVLFGRFLFKEKLRANHYGALVFGIAAVILMKL